MLKDISDLEAGDQKVLGISCDFTKGERVVVTDLTKEHPNKTLWRFLLPMMLSVMFQQIYNIADSMIAGKFAGEDALAAVGASYPITVIFMAFAVGMNLGTSVIVSRLFGAGDRKGVKRAVTTAFAASGVLGIALTVFGAWACRSMMVWIRTPENILADGELYLKIYVFGLLFLMLYNVVQVSVRHLEILRLRCISCWVLLPEIFCWIFCLWRNSAGESVVWHGQHLLHREFLQSWFCSLYFTDSVP